MLDFSTPTSSPSRASRMGSPNNSFNSPASSPIKANLFSREIATPVKRDRTGSAHWIEGTKNVYPSNPQAFAFLTPLRPAGEGSYCRCTYNLTPDGEEVVRRDFTVGFGQTEGESKNRVVPRYFRSQVKALQMMQTPSPKTTNSSPKTLPHCLSPLFMDINESNFGTTLEVSQLFPAGIPLEKYVQENPEKAEELSDLWLNAVFETNKESGLLLVDPKPENAVILMTENGPEIRLIDVDFMGLTDDDDRELEDIISCEYLVYNGYSYETALYLGWTNIRNVFTLSKEELLAEAEKLTEDDLAFFYNL